ncbi:MAG: SGNH/GDSL hydrolase family protein [archaeon]
MTATKLVLKIALAVFSILFTLFFLEIILRLSYPLYADYNTEMWRYTKELKQRSDLPNLGHEHIPNKSVILYGVEIRTNQLGLRANREYVIPKPKNTVRILVLGDSIALGWGVNYYETFPNILESILNQKNPAKYEVLNAAVGNYNTENELGALQKYLSLDPDIIIVGYTISDMEKIKYPGQSFIRENSYLYSFLFDKFAGLRFIGKETYYEYYHRINSDENNKVKQKKIIDKLIDASGNRTVIVVNIPDFHKLKGYEFGEENDFTNAMLANRTEVIYLDLLPVFQNQSMDTMDFWVTDKDPHPNNKAHRLIAEQIYMLINSDPSN